MDNFSITKCNIGLSTDINHAVLHDRRLHVLQPAPGAHVHGGHGGALSRRRSGRALRDERSAAGPAPGGVPVWDRDAHVGHPDLHDPQTEPARVPDGAQ